MQRKKLNLFIGTLKNKYQILGRKVDSLSGDFIYDLFDTNKGKVWVKVSFAAGSDG